MFQHLSGQESPITEGFQIAESDLPAQLDDERLQVELLRQKVAAIQSSLSNLSEVLAGADTLAAIGDYRWTAGCTYVYCCKWGPPPGGQGTAVCIEQCCGGYANSLERA